MDEGVPDVLKKAAILQVVSGLLNILVLPVVLSLGSGCIGGVCSVGACVLVPVGLLETTAGAVSLFQPDRGAIWMRYATWAEYLSLLGGGIHSAIVGYLVSGMLEDAEVQIYLEGPR